MSKLENFFAGFVSYIQHLRELFYLSLAIALLQFTGCCVNQDENMTHLLISNFFSGGEDLMKKLLMIYPVILIAEHMDRRESINASVNKDVTNIFGGKTYSQLLALQKQINQKIASGDAVDIGINNYFIHVLDSVKLRY